MTLYHDAQRELQDRFDTRRLADRLEERKIHDELSEADAQFVAVRDVPTGTCWGLRGGLEDE